MLLFLMAVLTLTQSTLEVKKTKSIVTYVTCLYDLGRGQLAPGQSQRSFDTYLQRFKQVLKTDAVMVVFGEESLRQFVERNRNMTNTHFVTWPRSKIKDQWFSKLLVRNIQERQQHWSWTTSRLHNHFKLPLYLPMTYHKIVWMLHTQQINPFRSQVFYWIDAGFTHVGRKTDQVFNRTSLYRSFQLWTQNPFVFRKIFWGNDKIAYRIDKQYTNLSLQDNRPIGGWQGARTEVLPTANNALWPITRILLERRQAASQQIIFAIAQYRYPLLFGTAFIEDDPRSLYIHLNSASKPHGMLTTENTLYFQLQSDPYQGTNQIDLSSLLQGIKDQVLRRQWFLETRKIAFLLLIAFYIFFLYLANTTQPKHSQNRESQQQPLYSSVTSSED